MSADTLLMGAVAYDAKVVSIWDGFQKHFDKRGLDFDYVLYSNYERQVEAHFAGHIHVAWNSPLAWVQSVWQFQMLAPALSLLLILQMRPPPERLRVGRARLASSA